MSGIILENLGAFRASNLETVGCNPRLGLHDGSTVGNADDVQCPTLSDDFLSAE